MMNHDDLPDEAELRIAEDESKPPKSIFDEPETEREIQAMIEKRDAETEAQKAQAWEEHRQQMRKAITSKGYQYTMTLINELLDDAKGLRENDAKVDA